MGAAPDRAWDPGRARWRSRRPTNRGGHAMGGTLVCGVSETPDGRSAAELGRALVARLGLRLVLVHVLDGVPEGTQESLSARQRHSGAEQLLDHIARDVGDGT